MAGEASIGWQSQQMRNLAKKLTVIKLVMNFPSFTEHFQKLAFCLFGLLFHPEDEGRNVGKQLQGYLHYISQGATPQTFSTT
jgi:hypothetical protein